MNSFMLILTFLPLGGIAKLIIVARTFESLHHTHMHTHIDPFKAIPHKIDGGEGRWALNNHFSTQLPEFLL